MDKRLSDKSKFFKREGFYVILFVCLCIVATVAAIAARNNKAVNKPSVAQQKNTNKNSIASTNPTQVPRVEVPNALQVKGNSSKPIAVPKNGSSSAVSKNNDFKFAKPVNGTLARGFSTDLVLCQTIGTYKTDNGIEIQAKLDSPVYAVLDGKVEKVSNDETELGEYIVINHQNGLKTIYSNLNPAVKVKVGDVVKKGQLIGKVGNTRASYSEESYGSHLHFEVMQGKNYVDPAKYVVYSPAKQQ